ncbi:MAG: hypothetical protein PUP93_08145 [Rhizonema sp. NSF051]|nr:hypothetical protein [Rhizonema sp. NSF051]
MIVYAVAIAYCERTGALTRRIEDSLRQTLSQHGLCGNSQHHVLEIRGVG